MKNSFKKIISLVLTVLMLAGTVTMLVPITASAASETQSLKMNETDTINGIKYRFDVMSDHVSSSSAKVNADGSWEFTISNGDMLWFPGIELTADSKIHAEVTNAGSGPINSFVAFTYGVMGTESDGYSTASVATVATNARLRPASVTRKGIGDGVGNGGDVRPFKLNGSNNDGNYASEQGNPKSAAWQAVVATTAGSRNWLGGKTISFDISKNSDTNKVTVEYGNPMYGALTSSDNTSYTCEDLPYVGGSVGFTSTWQGSETEKYTFRFDEIIITNCKVGGVEMSSYRIGAGKPIEPHTEFEVDGKTYRFDPLDGHAYSRCLLMPDGSIRLRIRPGDLFWMPETRGAEGAVLKATMLENEGQNNTSDLYASLAYNVDVGDDGIWAADDDSAYLAVWKTNRERRICTITKKQIVDGATPTSIGKLSNTKFSDSSYADRWYKGETISIELSKADSYKDVTGDAAVVSFKDATGNEIMDDYHAISAGGYALNGCIGFVVPWTRNATSYSCFDILELTAVMPATAGVSDEAVNLSLNGTIGLNFAFNATNLAGATVVAKKNGVEVVNQPVVNGENLVTVPVNAKEMTDAVNFSIMVDGEVFDDKSYTWSVAEYAAELKKLSEYAEWVELIDAMLNYGAAAQKLLNYKADEADVSGIVDYDFTAFEPVSFSGDKSILKGLHMNLSLESDTVLNLYFMSADGVTLTVTVNGEAAELTDNGDGYYVLSISGIAADKLSDDFAIVVNGELSFAVNALDWARIASESAETEIIANALAAYADAAERKN